MIGKIEVITGCMFSGKSEELIRRLRRFQIAKLNTIAFKPLIDVRYSKKEIVSHNGQKFTAIPVNNSTIIGFDTIDSDYDVVAIDEAQFFDLDLVKTVKRIAFNGKRVIIAGLDMDFRGEPFGPMPYLLSIADDVLKLKAVCSICGGEATMTQRLINGKPANYNDPTILVGGIESYEARCKEHHIVLNVPETT
jgi:thymidine kinase